MVVAAIRKHLFAADGLLTAATKLGWSHAWRSASSTNLTKPLQAKLADAVRANDAKLGLTSR